MRSDLDHLNFLTVPSAAVVASFEQTPSRPELLLLANRAGILSFANVLLWLHANNWRRELLLFNELSFFAVSETELLLRIVDSESSKSNEFVRLAEERASFEWWMCDEELLRIGLALHRLACRPEHEYDFFEMTAGSACDLRVRMTDSNRW